MNIKKFLKILFQTQRQNAEAKQIAKHLSQVLLYELKKEDALYPDLREKYLLLKEVMNKLDMPIALSETFRSAKKQNSYYKKVPKITNAKGLQSYHQYGLAMDCISKKYGWEASYIFWNRLGKEGKKLGFTWGGDWKFRDVSHFEWHPSFTWQDLENYFKRSTD